jgi:type II secretory pathway pseudopilin PulG
MERRSPPGKPSHSRARARESGFTYLGLIAAIAIMAILLTMASRVWIFSAQRDKEAELLWTGDQFRMAISRYYASGHQFPLTLEDLVMDKRYPVPRHYLRKLYRDPLTGESDWTLIMDPTGVAITGVASKSKLKPIKRKGFDTIEFGFEDADSYGDWKFVYVPRRGWQGLPPLPGTTPTPLGPGTNPGLPPAGTPTPAPGVPLPPITGTGR